MGAIALGAAGLAAGIGGSILQGQAAGRDARKARDYYNMRTGEGFSRYGRAFYGKNFEDLITSSYDTPEGRAAGARFNEANGGPILNQMKALSEYGRRRLGDVSSGYDDATRRVLDQYGNLDRMASGYGAGRDAIIDRETTRGAKADDAQLAAQLAASGFGGSTTAASVRSGSRRRWSESASDQKQKVAEDVVNRRLGIGSAQAAALQQMLGAKLGFDERGLGVDLELQQAPISAQQQVLSSSIAQPWLNQNTSQYYPGVSGAAAGLMEGGRVAAGFGGQMLAQQQMQALMQQYGMMYGGMMGPYEP